MLLAVLDESQWREDIPRLVRGAMGRQQSGRWNTTVANAWGVLAMEKFSAVFESTPVTGATNVRYASKDTQVTWPVNAASELTRLPWENGRSSLDVTHRGTGAPWVMIRATAALPLDKPLSSGYKTTRTIAPVEQQTPGRWTRGDVARVTLQIEAQSDMSWVVVDDPVPAGATILGSGLGGQSGLLTRQERREGAAWLAFEERKFDAFRAYYRFVPKGTWTIEYTVRLNNPGQFQLPATRVEAMYAPEMFGELPNAVLVVEPQR
jgi:alpha-2-macroglobulin